MKYKLNAGGSCQKASSCQSNFEGWGGSKDSLCVLLVISFTSDFVNKMPALTHSLYFVKLLALGGHSMLEEDYFEYWLQESKTTLTSQFEAFCGDLLGIFWGLWKVMVMIVGWVVTVTVRVMVILMVLVMDIIIVMAILWLCLVQRHAKLWFTVHACLLYCHSHGLEVSRNA